jgi:hypothetical protein
MDRIAKRGCLTAAAAALVLLIPAAALAAAGAGGGRHHYQAGKAPVQAAACPPLHSGTAIPPGPPLDLAWRNIGKIPVPVSASVGPVRFGRPAWTCYAHSPIGAVMAVYGISAALSGPDWQAAAAREIVPGPGQQAFIMAGQHQHYVPPAARVARPVGFTVVAYTARQATIEIVAVAGSEFAAGFRTVVWDGADWKLAMMPGGMAGPGPELLSSAAGITMWGEGNA